MKVKKYPFRNPELSWLSFNARVLQEASDHRNPLYERLKFLAIFSSNLDEFFKVKVSKLRQIKEVSKPLRKKLILKPTKKLKAINKEVLAQQEQFGSIFENQLIPKLNDHGIHLITKEEFSASNRLFAAELFQKEIKSKIETKHVHDTKELFLKDGTLYLAIEAAGLLHAFIEVPVKAMGRFVQFPAKEAHTIAFLEEFIKDNLEQLFPNKQKLKAYEVKLSRDAELYLDDDYEGELAAQVYENLSQRKKGQATRLLYDNKMPEALKNEIRKSLSLGKVDMIPGGTYHNFSDFFSFPDPTENPDLHFKKINALEHPILKADNDYFEIIKTKDQVIHFPYQSFDVLERFISVAAEDIHVTTIKISLYRIARESKLTDALLRAAENGKEVVVFVEAQARFDEANNYEWGKRFEAKGIKVFYSMKGIKVHSKILQIYRKQGSSIDKFAFIGTGNFNAKTARIYCDHGLFTAHPGINSDLSLVFSVLEGQKTSFSPNHLLVSPFNTRERFELLIDQEITNAKNGLKSGIMAKMNSLTDTSMITKLYEASQAGVPVRLIVRGMCSLIPGITGVSDGIFITSILDRYLEHGRIYKFQNADDPLLFMGSADWMPRNLDRRIEVLAPILDASVFRELNDLLEIQLNDTFKARIIDMNETNTYVNTSNEMQPALRSQYEQIRYLSKKQNINLIKQ
ncbi:polyphosphate kinase 1 [Flavobacteriaceae bacterium M23B6Z8]